MTDHSSHASYRSCPHIRHWHRLSHINEIIDTHRPHCRSGTINVTRVPKCLAASLLGRIFEEIAFRSAQCKGPIDKRWERSIDSAGLECWERWGVDCTRYTRGVFWVLLISNTSVCFWWYSLLPRKLCASGWVFAARIFFLTRQHNTHLHLVYFLK